MVRTSRVFRKLESGKILPLKQNMKNSKTKFNVLNKIHLKFQKCLLLQYHVQDRKLFQVQKVNPCLRMPNCHRTISQKLF